MSIKETGSPRLSVKEMTSPEFLHELFHGSPVIVAELTLELPLKLKEKIGFYVGNRAMAEKLLNEHSERMPVFTLYVGGVYKDMLPERQRLQKEIDLPNWYPDPKLTLRFKRRCVDDVFHEIMKTCREKGFEFEYGIFAGDSRGTIPIDFKAKHYTQAEINRLKSYLQNLEGAVITDIPS